MALYTYFLKSYGVNGLISKTELYDDDDNSVQDFELSITVTDSEIDRHYTKNKKRIYRRCCIRMPINILYIIFICCNLLWPCVLAIVVSIINNNIMYVYSNIFAFLYPIQHYVGLIYYQKKHFINNIKRYKKYYIYINIVFVLFTIISILLSTTSILLIVNNIYSNIYSDAYVLVDHIAWKIFICITIFVGKFYSYNIFFTNMIAYSIIFIIRCNEIKNYSHILKDYVKQKKNELTIESITKDYSELKSSHSQSIEMLNNMFTSIAVVGLIEAMFTIKYYNTIYIYPIHYVNIILFLITEVIYIYVIKMVKESVSNISSIINSPEFIQRYLSRTQLDDLDLVGEEEEEEDNISNLGKTLKKNIYCTNTLEHYNHNMINITLRNMIKISENAKGIDWSILTTKLGDDWEKFKFFGFEIDDETVIEKFFVIFGFLIGILNLRPILAF